MKVTFKSFGSLNASGRYRAAIPAQELYDRGIKTGNDWLVIGKHSWTWDEETAGFKRVCFDVCDDHFNDHLADHYKECCAKADLITCNSRVMRHRIRAATGRDAVVIPDPYEQREETPRVHDRLLWFGYKSNLCDLEPYAKLPNLEVVTNLDDKVFTQWSPENMDAAFSRAGMVIIPTGKSMAKSGNRAIESIRRGLFVVAGFLPAYADLGIWMGSIPDGIDWALSHRMEVIDRIKASQAYVKTEYSPKRIGDLWMEALSV